MIECRPHGWQHVTSNLTQVWWFHDEFHGLQVVICSLNCWTQPRMKSLGCHGYLAGCIHHQVLYSMSYWLLMSDVPVCRNTQLKSSIDQSKCQSWPILTAPTASTHSSESMVSLSSSSSNSSGVPQVNQSLVTTSAEVRCHGNHHGWIEHPWKHILTSWSPPEHPSIANLEVIWSWIPNSSEMTWLSMTSGVEAHKQKEWKHVLS